MAILIKEIKPSRLKVDAMRLELLNAMRKVGTEVKKDYEKTTKTWKHKPKFEVSVSLKQPGPTLIVETDDEIYGYVDKGTKPHLIFAGIYTGKSNKKALAFPSKFGAKTRPGVIGKATFRADKTGRFTFRCSETCGAFHPYMIGFLTVEPNTRYLGFIACVVGVSVLAAAVVFLSKKRKETA